jgi:hypothetical protein
MQEYIRLAYEMGHSKLSEDTLLKFNTWMEREQKRPRFFQKQISEKVKEPVNALSGNICLEDADEDDADKDDADKDDAAKEEAERALAQTVQENKVKAQGTLAQLEELNKEIGSCNLQVSGLHFADHLLPLEGMSSMLDNWASKPTKERQSMQTRRLGCFATP